MQRGPPAGTGEGEHQDLNVEVLPPRPAGRERLLLRDALRLATADVHARLHLHPGLAAVAAGRIDIAGYRSLLHRLHGFYRPFEAAAGLPPLRSDWLARDLDAIGAAPGGTRHWCARLPPLDSSEAILGALYVVEGSALGGRGLARQLGGLLGENTLVGRRFFASDGADPGIAWRAFVDQLAAVPAAARAQRTVIGAAVGVFGSFETWLEGWETPGNA